MADSAASSISLQRSSLSASSTDTITELARPHSQEVSTGHFAQLPFLVTPLYAPHEQLLRFLPGSFRYGGKVLGQGASFVVEKHYLHNIYGHLDDVFSAESFASRGDVFAVKRLRNQAVVPRKTYEEVERELLVLNLLRGSKNVIQLYGLGWETAPVDGKSRLWPVLVLEYARHGSLDCFQKHNPDISYAIKRKLALDVASGLDELRAEKLSHGDLKSENVLICGEQFDGLTAKLSDFGFSPVDFRSIMSGGSSAALCVTGIWSAPERPTVGNYASFGARDTYSWGLLVLRLMLGGRNPFQVDDGRFTRNASDASKASADTSILTS